MASTAASHFGPLIVFDRSSKKSNEAGCCFATYVALAHAPSKPMSLASGEKPSLCPTSSVDESPPPFVSSPVDESAGGTPPFFESPEAHATAHATTETNINDANAIDETRRRRSMRRR